MIDAHVLKNLQTQRLGLVSALDQAKTQLAEIEAAIKADERKLHDIDRQIESIKARSGGIVISEHALLRYCERVLRINLVDVRNAILPEKTAEIIETLGNGKYPVLSAAGQFRVIVRDGVVVTVE